MRTIPAIFLLCLLLVGSALGQAPQPGPPAERPPEELTVLKEFPKEIMHEGTRLYDFELDPPPGAALPAGSRIAFKFKYETDKPGKIFIGSMVMVKDQPGGGYQPATLTENEGTAEVGLFSYGYFGHGHGGGGGAALKTPTTLDEVKATFQKLNQMEVTVYGMVEKQGKFRMPQEYTVIPMAPFTVQDKFYLDRLLKEVIALRKRVQELEAKGQ